jgi:hypothetical protein
VPAVLPSVHGQVTLPETGEVLGKRAASPDRGCRDERRKEVYHVDHAAVYPASRGPLRSRLLTAGRATEEENRFYRTLL